MRRRQADRRVKARFEVVGDLWGTVETVLRLPLRNVGLTGALIESHVPLAIDSVHRIAWDAGGEEMSAEVRVRHVKGAPGADGEQTYLVGVEFVAPNPVLADQIQRWLAGAAGAVDTSGV